MKREREGGGICKRIEEYSVVEHNAEFLLAAKNRSQAVSVGMTAVGMDQSIF